jgi:uncharacterized protein with HEPN domain
VSGERWRADLDSMIAASERARGYVTGMTYADFLDDTRTQDAVVMNLVVLAEAQKGIPAEVRSLAPEVPWAAIGGFRNRAAHLESTVDLSLDLSIVWQICSRDLVELLAGLKRLRDVT